MTCSGCKLSWALSEADFVIYQGQFTLLSGNGLSPTLPLVTFNDQQWGTIQASITSGSHGSCSGVTSGHCSGAAPCAGVRGAITALSGGYQFAIEGYTANTINPFWCGEEEFVSFHAIDLSGQTVSPTYTLVISCSDCIG